MHKINQPIDWESIEKSYDWFREMKDVPQDAIWHAEGDVQIHTKMVVEALVKLEEFQILNDEEKHILFTAALLHDVEKRSTTTTEMIDGKERIVSPRHAKKGEGTARRFLFKEQVTPFIIREQITKLVRWHGMPIWAIEKSDPQKAVIKTSLEVNTHLLYLLSKADVVGRICSDQEELLYKIELFKSLCQENDCYGKAKAFLNNYSRWFYLNKTATSPNYEYFDENKFEVTLMCALPGTGKDYYIKNHLRNLPVLSLDEIRRSEKISPTDSKKQGLVIQMAKEQAKVYMRKKQDFVFNATNVSKDRRSKWTSLFKEYGARIKIVYLEVPYKQLYKQNRDRKHQVPDKIMERMMYQWEIPSYDEAVDIEWVVS